MLLVWLGFGLGLVCSERARSFFTACGLAAPNFCGEMVNVLLSVEWCEGVEEVLLTADGDGLEVRFRTCRGCIG